MTASMWALSVQSFCCFILLLIRFLQQRRWELRQTSDHSEALDWTSEHTHARWENTHTLISQTLIRCKNSKTEFLLFQSTMAAIGQRWQQRAERTRPPGLLARRRRSVRWWGVCARWTRRMTSWSRWDTHRNDLSVAAFKMNPQNWQTSKQTTERREMNHGKYFTSFIYIRLVCSMWKCHRLSLLGRLLSLQAFVSEHMLRNTELFRDAAVKWSQCFLCVCL